MDYTDQYKAKNSFQRKNLCNEILRKEKGAKNAKKSIP